MHTTWTAVSPKPAMGIMTISPTTELRTIPVTSTPLAKYLDES